VQITQNKILQEQKLCHCSRFILLLLGSAGSHHGGEEAAFVSQKMRRFAMFNHL
jgi:hypothetical protein